MKNFERNAEIKIENTNTVIVHLDQLKDWEFKYKGKIYKLNVEELLRLLKLIKNEN